MRKILALALFATVSLVQAQIEKRDVHIAVGGKSAFYYLPLTIAEQLGYFKEQGLEVKISDFAGGAAALRAVVGGSAEVVSGAYEHTISMQGRKQYMRAFVLQGRLPQIALGVGKAKAGTFKSMKDLKGMKIGVSAPGSSTHNLVKQLLAKAGLDPDKDVSIVGAGVGAGAIAAMKSGQLDAISNVDPVMTKLEMDGDVRVVADTRNLKGTQEVWGAPLPAGCLYAPEAWVQKYPGVAQALASAIVRADQWIAKASATDVARVVPESYLLGDRALYLFSFDKVKEAISPDGLIAEAGAKATLAALRAFDKDVKGAQIDLGRTYTNEFARKANARVK
ncbi:MAG: ABC transporter substrate-binding protein [Burkholderiales bacterium]|nr:ABC transporter substrate-binding protein [Burkholderiales bacterium]